MNLILNLLTKVQGQMAPLANSIKYLRKKSSQAFPSSTRVGGSTQSPCASAALPGSQRRLRAAPGEATTQTRVPHERKHRISFQLKYR